MQTFGERVERARRQLNPMPSGSDIARQVGVDPPKFNRWLRMVSEPPVPFEVYFRLADVLKTPIFTLMSEELAESATADRVIRLAVLSLSGDLDLGELNNVLDKVESNTLKAQQCVSAAAGDLAVLRRIIRELVR